MPLDKKNLNNKYANLDDTYTNLHDKYAIIDDTYFPNMFHKELTDSDFDRP